MNVIFDFIKLYLDLTYFIEYLTILRATVINNQRVALRARVCG